jgi:hypothetical protein
MKGYIVGYKSRESAHHEVALGALSGTLPVSESLTGKIGIVKR